MSCLIQMNSCTLIRIGEMTSSESGGAAQNSAEAAALEQPRHRPWPSTRREWLLHAGAGFGGLALVDLLSRDLAAGTEPSADGSATAPSWRQKATATSVIF